MPKPLEDVLADWNDAPYLTVEGDAEAEEMAKRLRRLDERHQPVAGLYDIGVTIVDGVPAETVQGRASCKCGGPWPCPDRRLLEGEER